MFVLDPEDGLSLVGTSLADWLGRDRDALADTSLEEVIVPADTRAVRDAAADVREAPGEATRVLTVGFIDAVGAHRHAETELVASTDGTVVGSVRRGEAVTDAEDERDRFGRLFHLIDDAVVEVEIVDGEPIVRAVNPGFEEVFGYDAEAVRGDSLNEYVVPDDEDEQATEFDRRTARGKANYAVVTRRTAVGVRQFLYRGLPYRGPDGRRYGLAVYTDITEQQRRERHHEVLHRVLRHNLRNELSVILGAAEEIAREGDGWIVERANLAAAAAEDLAELSDMAAHVEHVFAGDTDREPIDVVDVVERVVAEYRGDYPDASIETDLPVSLPIAAGAEVHSAIANLVENGLEHNEGEPTVRVSAARETDNAVIDVVDDGPGIPRSEREPVFDDASISQLSHGSGLGLWLVKWVVEAYGGDVAYERQDGETVVTLRLVPAESVPG